MVNRLGTGRAGFRSGEEHLEERHCHTLMTPEDQTW